MSWRLRKCIYNKGVEDQLGTDIGQVVYTVGEKPSLKFEYVREMAVEDCFTIPLPGAYGSDLRIGELVLIDVINYRSTKSSC